MKPWMWRLKLTSLLRDCWLGWRAKKVQMLIVLCVCYFALLVFFFWFYLSFYFICRPTGLLKIFWCVVTYCIVLYCIVLYCVVLNCIVLYCIVLYCIVLYCIVLCCIVSCCSTYGAVWIHMNMLPCNMSRHYTVHYSKILRLLRLR